jgi:hypothetical protein
VDFSAAVMNDPLVTAKAKAVTDAAGIVDPEASLGGLQGIIQFILSLFGGLGACTPTGTTPPPAKMRRAVTHPGIIERRTQRRLLKETVPNSALRPAIEYGAQRVAATSTDAELISLYKLANGGGTVTQ